MHRLVTYLRGTVLVLALFGTPEARADIQIELITNGGFEAGDFTGWSVTDQLGGSGSWFVESTATTPVSMSPTVGPAAGAFYAVTDQAGPGAHVLTQAFTVLAGSSVTLSFDMFVNSTNLFNPDLGPSIVHPSGLDYTTGGTFEPNQHARVDLLSAGADPFDTGAGVLRNFFLGTDLGDNPHPYTNYSFEITALVGGGGTFLLRFAEVDNQGLLNQGVDNVSIVAQPGAVVPEPGSVLLLALGVLGLFGSSGRFRRQAA